MKKNILPVGKLDSDILKKIVFDKIKLKRDEIKTGPGIGEDCAVVDFGEYDCVLSTDPITASVNDIGSLAIHISCNDIASNGIEPLGILLAVMLPIGTTEEELSKIMEQAAIASEHCGVEIMGGHTEITPAVNQPIIVSTAIGKSIAGFSAAAEEMQEGDLIYMTKKAGLEGTGIIACDFETALNEFLTCREIETAKNFLLDVSVIKEGVVAGKIGTHGMHDVTEGGILGAIWEMCNISRKGAYIIEEKIPVDDITKKICYHFDLDYLRLISSGCMIIVIEKAKAKVLEESLREKGVMYSCIGNVEHASLGIRLEKADGEIINVLPPSADELYKMQTK